MPEKKLQCPRCKELRMESEQALNSLSHRDGKTYICNPCGDEEAMIDLGSIEQTDTDKEFIKTHERSKNHG